MTAQLILASASPSEYAIDGGISYGGAATTAFYKCTDISSGADMNGDSIITLQEVKECAQLAINHKIEQWKEQDSNFSFSSQTITVGNGPGGNIPIAFQSTRLNSDNKPLSESLINSRGLLDTIQQGADANHLVNIHPAKQLFKIGRDYLEMTVTTNKAGYLTILSVGSSGKIFQLFPNKIDQKNIITPQTAFLLPRSSWRIPANGPAGTDRFLAVVSNKKHIFAGLGSSAGPFSKIENNAQEAKGLIRRLNNPVKNCKSTIRDFGIEASECTNSYGAGVIDVIEVE